MLLSTIPLTRSRRYNRSLVGREHGSISTVNVLLMSPRNLIRRLSREIGDTIRRTGPVRLITSIARYLPDDSHALISANRAFRVRLVHFLGRFKSRVIARTLGLTIGTFNINLVFIRELSRRRLMLGTGPLLSHFL